MSRKDKIRYAPLGNIGLAGLGLVEGAYHAFNSNNDVAIPSLLASFANVCAATSSIAGYLVCKEGMEVDNAWSFGANVFISTILPLSNEVHKYSYAPSITLMLTPYVSRAELITNPVEFAYNRIMDWRENRKKEE